MFDVGGVDIKNTLLIQHGSCQSEYTEHSQGWWVWVEGRDYKLYIRVQ